MKLCEEEMMHLGEDVKVDVIGMKKEMNKVKETLKHSVVNLAKDTEENVKHLVKKADTMILHVRGQRRQIHNAEQQIEHPDEEIMHAAELKRRAMEDIKHAEELIKRAAEDIKYLEQQIKHAEVEIELETEEMAQLKEVTKYTEMMQHLNMEILMEMELLNEKVKQLMEMKLRMEKKLSYQRWRLEKQRELKRGVQPWNTTQIGVICEQKLESCDSAYRIQQPWMVTERSDNLGIADVYEMACKKHVRSAGNERQQRHTRAAVPQKSYDATCHVESNEETGQEKMKLSLRYASIVPSLTQVDFECLADDTGQEEEKKTRMERTWLQPLHHRLYRQRAALVDTVSYNMLPYESAAQREELSVGKMAKRAFERPEKEQQEAIIRDEQQKGIHVQSDDHVKQQETKGSDAAAHKEPQEESERTDRHSTGFRCQIL